MAGLQEELTALRRENQKLRDVLTARGRLSREHDSDACENRLRGYLEASSDWFWEMDADCRFSYLSDSCEAVTGIPSDALLGKTREGFGVATGVDLEDWSEHLEIFAAHRSFRDFRQTRILSDGREVVLSTSGKAVFDEQGAFLGYRGTGRNITEQAAVERQARQAEPLLASAVESLSEYFVLWDAAGRLVLCNEMFRKLNEEIADVVKPGVRIEDYFRAGLAKGLYPNAEGRDDAWLAEVLHTHHNPTEPLEVQRKNGRWLLVHGQKLPDGSIVRIGTDITERKQIEVELQSAYDDLEQRVEKRTIALHRANAELRQENAQREAAQRKLRTSQAMLEAILDNFPDLTGLRDPDGNYLMVNKTFEDWYGVSRDEIVGKNVNDLWSSEKAEEFRERDAEAISTHTAVVRHIDIPYPDGQTRTVRSVRFPVFLDDTTLVGTGFINTDITHFMRVQREAVEKSSLLQTVLDAMPVNIALRDNDNRYRFANRHLAKSIGLPAQAFVGKTAAEVFANSGGAATDALTSLVARTGRPMLNHEHHAADESERVFLVNIVPIRGSDGQRSGTVGIGFDITERKKLEEQLRQSQKMEAVGQLTGGVAHDFNNLLGVILGNLDILDEQLAENQGPGSNTDFRKLVLTAMRAAEKGAKLNGQLLAFSRRQPLAPRAIDLNEQIAGMVDLLRRTLGETIEVEVVSDTTLWSCEADPAQVEAALLNLAINARDAMPLGGRLTIELANQELGTADVADQTELRAGSYVMLAVRDTGTGIPLKALEHVFEPFFTTKEVGQGSGLGLSMVFGFVKQSKGHVSIESSDGIGTTVRLFLPRSPDAVADQIEEEDSLPLAQGETVLVVEDDSEMKTLAVALLQKLGYAVLEACEGTAALAVLSSATRVDALFTDVVLPGGMDGSQVAAAVRAQFPSVKVLYMSGYPRDAIAHHGRLDDGVTLLEKPFRKSELARKLRETIDA
ncbi:MAG: PAS domain-containing protein [Alphaproteobacteria bacterium]|nr:PAS domain-containing protein [Alphaproteobacteria bacterium]